MYAARSQLVKNVVQPALERGDWVIGDRHDMSSKAYQGGGRGVPLSDLEALKAITIGQFEPDLVLYLDVEPSVGLERARGRGELDRIELSGLQFFEKARAMYKQLVSESSKAIEISAMQEMDKVHTELIRCLDEWYLHMAAETKVGMG
jgi:dTMP kinase